MNDSGLSPGYEDADLLAIKLHGLRYMHSERKSIE